MVLAAVSGCHLFKTDLNNTTFYKEFSLLSHQRMIDLSGLCPTALLIASGISLSKSLLFSIKTNPRTPKDHLPQY
jgi:hypothetical protein